MKIQYLAASAIGALTLGLAMPAMAQDTAPAVTTPPTASGVENAAVTPAAQEADDATSAEIVVTAQGRAQVLADVPVAISAVSSESLQNSGANDIRQLNQLAPSLLVSSTGNEANAAPRIRGIGTVGDNPGLESSVVVFIDGVYRSRSGIGMNELGEIDRVEVLRGPQGTLGGRNSSAGLISIISKQPSFNGFSGGAEATYGNYDFWRLAGNINAPLGDTVAARVDAVYSKRDGFYRDPANGTRVNDRDRFFGRAQLRFQPTSDINIRLIGDYTRRDEACCGAIYVGPTVNPYVGALNSPATPLTTGLANGNNIVNVLGDLGQDLSAFNRGYDRRLSVTPGRSYAGKTQDWGLSGQVDWNFGGAKLTSITAYRSYYNEQGGDIDYSSVDILYNAPDGNNRRAFKTFTQELRLNGEAFDGKLDWLIGGFYADEKFRGKNNLRFGNQYGRFATCRIVSGSFGALYSPTTPGCIGNTPNPAFGGATGRQVLAASLGAAAPLILAGFDRLEAVNNRGSTIDFYNQNSRSFAAFTHNIVHLTSTVDLTLGLRYTDERKRFNATFGNDNTACPAQQAALTPLLATPLAALAGGLISLTCQGNSTSELNGVSIRDSRKESEFTGTAVLSWKPTDDLLLYGSFSRGYKAGGFNFDRSALKSPIPTFASFGGGNAQAGAQALVRNLQFDPEKVDAFEIGAKYATGPFTLTAAAFRQQFKNFQLNTFDGTVFIVQNVNGCSASLAGADRDQSKFTGAPNYNAGATASGACPAGNVGYGVVSQGVELEAQLVPARDLRFGLGMTYADTRYRDNLVGTAAGAPLNQALRKLPGQRLSNAPAIVTTASMAFTPDIGHSGLSGLFYIDGRMTSDYNTGSDLFPQKGQDGFAIFNARIGVRGNEGAWAIEFWGQNIFNKQYAQVAFNSPFQEGATSTTAAFADPQYPGGRQVFSQFLAEPRTYGVTLRGKF